MITPFSTFSKHLLKKAVIFTAEIFTTLTTFKYIKGWRNYFFLAQALSR